MKDLSAASWESRYAEKNTPWDLAGATPELQHLLAQPGFPTKGRALVPGGGRGFDAVELARRGFDTHLVDFAPSPLDATLALASQSKSPVLVYRRDFFDFARTPALKESFHLLWEYTFFCAIDPQARAAYVEAVWGLLKPGALFAGLFFPTSISTQGPPFEVSRKEVEALFAKRFELTFLEPQASVKPRAGKEFVGLFRRL